MKKNKCTLVIVQSNKEKGESFGLNHCEGKGIPTGMFFESFHYFKKEDSSNLLNPDKVTWCQKRNKHETFWCPKYFLEFLKAAIKVWFDLKFNKA